MFKAPDEGNDDRSCRRDAPQEEQAFDVVGEVRQSDLRLRSRDPDGPDEQTHPILLLGEDMLDVRTDFRFGVISAPDRFRHRAPLRPLTMDMADEAVLPCTPRWRPICKRCPP